MRRTAGLLVLLAACATATPRHPRAPRIAAVPWERWDPQAFRRARNEHRLILIDVVAGWCHWCHVMDARTYADPEVAAILGEHFVAIRVDADARPEVAERYERWGWPATALLTPDAHPITERRGFQEPRSFATLLRGLADDLAAGRPLARRAPPPPAPRSPSDLTRMIPRARAFLDGLYDTAETGWGRPQKYPWPFPVEEAAQRARVAGDAQARLRLLATLENESRLLDPVWGGMFQYSTGGRWDHPHFEKIAMVQAGAIESFVLARRLTGEARWLDRAWSVARYLDRFLRDSTGGYGASQDADLGTHDPTGRQMDGHEFYALDDARRAAAGIPFVDPHVYADLDGSLIVSLCTLYEDTLDARALDDAVRAAERIQRTHVTGPGAYAHEPSALGTIVTLADEVAMGRAFLALDEATGERRWRNAAQEIAAFVLDRLDDPGGGFVAHTSDPEATGVFAERLVPFEANVQAARFLLRLHWLTGEERLRERALAALRAISPEALQHGTYVADYLLAVEDALGRHVHVAVVGRADDDATRALYRAALPLWDPRRVLERSDPGEKYPDIGHAAVYLCDDSSCSSPIRAPEELAARTQAFWASP
jgi:uncharacterized protein